MRNTNIQRRIVLKRLATAAAACAVPPTLLVPRMAFAANAAGEARFVVVLLRGALDGLAAVPPVGDAQYAKWRGEIAFGPASPGLRLDDLFMLHPSFTFLAEQWQQRQLAVLHAVATPYRERSHFDAQDMLESGHARPHASQSGWLNRMLPALPRASGTAATAHQSGVALGANVPLLMRGPTEVASWSPSRLPLADEDTLQRIADLYADDALLARRLAEGTASQQMAGDEAVMAGRGGAMSQFAQAAQTAAGFLARDDGPRIAVLETTGWDTHANQGAAQGALSARIGALDSGLRTLQSGLGAAWQRTAVLIVTEFGRTVAVNGTRGTDHGTGAAAFLVGGAVRGQVMADWPGLSTAQLLQARDLKPTLDVRAAAASVLRDHLGVDDAFIAREVFPDGPLARISGLVRG